MDAGTSMCVVVAHGSAIVRLVISVSRIDMHLAKPASLREPLTSAMTSPRLVLVATGTLASWGASASVPQARPQAPETGWEE